MTYSAMKTIAIKLSKSSRLIFYVVLLSLIADNFDLSDKISPFAIYFIADFPDIAETEVKMEPSFIAASLAEHLTLGFTIRMQLRIAIEKFSLSYMILAGTVLVLGPNHLYF